ncbi:MAG: hypothetical protein IKL65_00690 [Bacilli bacterium]|nr:hypothetical protein [Bacilli bacterium]
MIEKYNAEIRENRELLAAITVAMNQLIKMGSAGKDAKVVGKQSVMFEKLRQAASTDKFNKRYSAYEKNTYKNLTNLKAKYTDLDLSQIRKALESNSRRFNYNTVNKVMDVLERNHALDQKIIVLSQKYKDCINKIRNLEDMIEYEKQRQANKEKEIEKRVETVKTPQISYEEQQKLREEQIIKKINGNADILLNGPKKRGLIRTLQGVDMLHKDMEYLYGLAIDVLFLMNRNQWVSQKEIAYGKDARVWNAYFGSVDSADIKCQAILNAYGVSNVDQLLDKYDKIRNTYYKKFSKLSKEKKTKYAIEKFLDVEIMGGLGSGANSIIEALKNEKLEFPPSKEKLISYMNSRIRNGKNYEYVFVEKDEVTTSRLDFSEDYDKKKKYYKNLTKNMTEDEIAMLYHQVYLSMYEDFKYSDLDTNTIDRCYSVMQKLFCEIIFEKRKMKLSDIKQYDTALSKIAKEYLKEEPKFSTSVRINEEEKKEREETIRKEYVKYRAQLTLEGKKEHLSFREFVQQKYALNNVVEPENLNELIEEEIKGMKK